MSAPLRPTQSPTKPSAKQTKTTTWNKVAAAIISGVVILRLFVAVAPHDKILFASDVCSFDGRNNDTCIQEEEVHHQSSHHHRGKVIGANVKAADVRFIVIIFISLVRSSLMLPMFNHLAQMQQLAAAYEQIKSEYKSLALHRASNTNWQVLSSHSDGSEVSLLEHPTDPSCPYVRMTSVMPGTIQDVWVRSEILFAVGSFVKPLLVQNASQSMLAASRGK